METAVIILLTAVILAMGVKIYMMKKSMNEMAEQFGEILAEDTNALICVSSHDRDIRQLAYRINVQLKKYRHDRHRFHKGNMELKTAVTNISHDLRTPLTSILGYMDLLETEAKSENAEKYLSVIRNRAENMKQLTEELFQYSLDISEKEFVWEEVDICNILEKSLLSFYSAFSSRGIVPSIELPEQPVMVMADKSALNRIFSNIINNAVKYSEKSFCVTMNTDGEIVFSNDTEKMDMVSVGKLFDRFFTVSANRHSTGLGLSIAKYLTEAMHGTITADYQNKILSIRLVIKPVDFAYNGMTGKK